MITKSIHLVLKVPALVSDENIHVIGNAYSAKNQH
jgi:hypothetical protein